MYLVIFSSLNYWGCTRPIALRIHDCTLEACVPGGPISSFSNCVSTSLA